MNKVLIVGGTGFIGYWIAKKKPADTSVYIMGQNKYSDMEWFGANWDYIIHLAPIAPTKVLECAKRNNARVLYASSGAVYHPENTARKQYIEDKNNFEQECIDSGVDVVIARLFTFCGKKLDNQKAITTFYEMARANLPIVITGDGNTTRSYQHGSEMARWCWAILKHGTSGEAYDVGSDTPITMLELAVQIIAETRSSSEIFLGMGKDPMPYYMPEDTEKTKALLNL